MGIQKAVCLSGTGVGFSRVSKRCFTALKRNEKGLLTTALSSITIASSMRRIRQTIKVDGQECWTLFDTFARNTYVTSSVAQILKTSTMAHAFRTALGGEVKETKTSAILEAEVEGPPIATHALVIDEIGKDEEGRPIEILFGALAMQQWGIRPVSDEEKLDLSHYPEEFVKF